MLPLRKGNPMLLRHLLPTLESIAPLRFAESWDNVGLLAGDLDDQVTNVLLTIDLTKTVLDEARQHGCQLIIAYHPPIFDGLKRIDARSPVGLALRHGIALYSPHTALDAAPGGTNDVLADAAGLLSRAALKPAKNIDGSSDFTMRQALLSEPVGMGRIGPIQPVGRRDFIAQIKANLGLDQVLVAGPQDGLVTKVAVAAGAVGDLLKYALRQEADAIVCGEIRHHDALFAAACGVTVICARHSCSERQALTPLSQRLRDQHPEVKFVLSASDCDPLQFV